MKRRSLTFRVLVGAGVWIALSLGLGGYAVVEVFRASALRQYAAGLSEELDLLSVAVARNPDAPGARMTSPAFARVYSGLYWRASTGGATLRSRSLWEHRLPESPIGAARIPGPDGQVLRVLTRAVTTPDGAPWRLSVAGDLASLEADLKSFRGALAIAWAVLTLTVTVAALLVLRVAVVPVAEMLAAVGIPLKSRESPKSCMA